MSKKNISYLVCVNKEKYSETALHFACKLANKNKSKIKILHVIEPADYQTLGAVATKMKNELFTEAEKMLKRFVTKMQKWDSGTPETIIKEGLIETEIISVIDEDSSINMLITGTAADSGIKSKILPPLVASLGTKLNIPMLIVPGNLTPKQIEELV